MDGLKQTDDRVFSRQFKENILNRSTFTLIGLVVLPAPLIIKLAEYLEWQAFSLEAVCGIAAILTLSGIILWTNFRQVSYFATLKRRLRDRLTDQGLDTDGHGGIFVSLAPDSIPRDYDEFTDWDIGFAFFLGDEFCYVGERARFALRRSQIRTIELIPGAPGWMAIPMIHVAWSEPSLVMEGSFLVWPGSNHPRLKQIKLIRAFAQTFESWRREGATAKPPPYLSGLPLPRLDGSEGKVFGKRHGRWNQPADVLFIAFLAWLLGWLLGLSFITETGGAGWYVVLIAVFAICFVKLPLWCYRPPSLS
jgi:hypothetical protein